MTKVYKISGNESGVTLAEVLVSLSIVGTLSLVGTTMLQRSGSTVKQIELTNVMSSIAKDIEAHIQKPGVVGFSAYMEGNSHLEHCILSHSQYKPERYQTGNEGADSTPTTCTATDPTSQISLPMYRQPRDWENIDAAVMRRLKISGSEQKPLWRDTNGKKCSDPREAKCRLKVVTYMWATCPRAADSIRKNIVSGVANTPLRTTCFRAQTVHFRYQVTYVPVDQMRQASNTCIPFPDKFPSVPRDEVFWGGSGNKCQLNASKGFRRKVTNTVNAFPVDVSQIGRYSDFIEACKTNYTMIEVRDSKPVCKCLPPYKEFKKGLTSSCNLANHTCGSEQRYMGTDLEGNPRCKDVKCVTMEVTLEQKNMTDFSCEKKDEVLRKGAWLNRINVTQNSGSGNCSCEDRKDGPDPDIKGWYSRCKWRCSFEIECCWE